MKPNTVLLLVCFGISITSLIVALRRPDPPAVTSSDQESRIARLEEALAALDGNDGNFVSDPIVAAGGGGGVLEARLRALEESVSSWLAAPDRGTDGEMSVEEIERTRLALDTIRYEEMGAQMENWVEKEQLKAKGLVEAIGKRLELDSGEQAAVARIFEDESHAQGTMLEELWNAGPPRDAPDDRAIAKQLDLLTEYMKEIRDKRDGKLKEVLGANRYEQFQRIAKERPQARRARTRQKP